MKVEMGTVVEIALGVLIAGVVLIAINGLFGGFFASHGVTIHGADSTGKVA